MHTFKALKPSFTLSSSLLLMLAVIGLVSSSNNVFADNNSFTDTIGITVPTSCSMGGTVDTEHNATLQNGTYSASTGSDYENGIGKTTLTVFCNDNNGFSVYTIGYTGNEDDGTNSTKLVGVNTGSTINTKVYESGDTTSNWSMRVNKVADSEVSYIPNNMTITNGYNNWHIVPNLYEQVATYKAETGSSATDTTLGAKLETTYAAYISSTQPADTYQGKVKYVLVHPYDHAAPIASPATLDTGKAVNSKLKSLAATVVNGYETTITPTFNPRSGPDAYDEYIKFISVHLKTPTPSGFTPTEMNTISSSSSKKPIYIVFDNTNNSGIMHFYTEGEQIILPSDSSFMFYLFRNLADLSVLSDWDASNVTDMNYMFGYAGDSVSTFTLDLSSWDTSSVTDMSHMFDSAGLYASAWSLGDLSSWDVSNVTNMSSMFDYAGRSTSTWSVGDISPWDTSSVTDMSYMFYYAGGSASSFILDLSSWDTSSVTDMNYMFSSAGQSASTFILNLSSWDASNVTDMSYMFYYAGSSASTFTLDLSSWDTSGVTDMSDMFGSTGVFASDFTLDLSSWDTSSVTDMSDMFYYAGQSASTWSVTIPRTNGNNISNTTSRIYGETTSVYCEPYGDGKSFTLAQP